MDESPATAGFLNNPQPNRIANPPAPKVWVIVYTQCREGFSWFSNEQPYTLLLPCQQEIFLPVTGTARPFYSQSF